MTGWEIERSQGNPCEVMHLRTSRIWTPICPGTRKGRPKIMELELELLAHHPASRLSAPSNATSSEEAGRANHIRLVAGQPGPGSSSVIAFLRWLGTLRNRAFKAASSDAGDSIRVQIDGATEMHQLRQRLDDRKAVPAGSALVVVGGGEEDDG